MRLALMLALFCNAGAPELSQERLLLHTVAGDLVLVLYPTVAPQHVAQVLTLARLGVYNGTHFYRVEPGFVVQTSTAEDRTTPLSDAQRAAIHKLPAEFSALKHERGVLSMARWDEDVNSGETSFSILLGPAPHLDGKYTIFGRLEAGDAVLRTLEQAQRKNATQPATRLEISSVEVLPNAAALAERELAGPRALPYVPLPESPRGAFTPLSVPALVGLLLVASVLGAFVVVIGRRVAPRSQGSLLLLLGLIDGFVLLIVLIPYVQGTLLSAVLFLCVLGLFKMMNRFESDAAS